MGEVSATETLERVTEEGRRLAEAAREAGLPLVLIGGVAVWLQCPSARCGPLAREYGDADLIGRTRDRREITGFMDDHGYEADRRFNALHGATRLNFHDPTRDRPVDVLLDRFAMCHELDLRDSRSADGRTIALADLLLTKLQVVDLNRKDVLDICALLLDHEFGAGDDDVDLERILAVTHSDWGFEHTIHRTLATIREQLATLGLAPQTLSVVAERAEELDAALRAAPKARRWKLRARVGERVRWYEQPEEARA